MEDEGHHVPALVKMELKGTSTGGTVRHVLSSGAASQRGLCKHLHFATKPWRVRYSLYNRSSQTNLPMKMWTFNTETILSTSSNI